MGLREDALAAAEAARVERVEAARAALGTVLAPSDVSALTVAAETPELVVFCDGPEGMCLAVREPGTTGDRVSLVHNDNGWTSLGAVTSLAQLGLLLARAGA